MMLKRTVLPLFLLLALAVTVQLGCGYDDEKLPDSEVVEETEAILAGPDVTEAVAVLHPTEGNSVTGVVNFTMTDTGMLVVAEVEGLTPGNHGFHIHELGDCSAPDGTSAGGHFNPTGMPHGAPTDAQRHMGDLGNIEAGEDGIARLEWVDPYLTFEGAVTIVGRAVIVHAGEDDLTSQPTGAAGARVACGVIGIAAEAATTNE